MANITLSIPEEIYRIMKRHKELRWSQIAREAIINHVKKLEIMDSLSSKSELELDDIEQINEKIKKELYSKLKK